MNIIGWMSILYAGKWWNPWPNIQNVRQDWPFQPIGTDWRLAMSWPFVRMPHPSIVEEYERTQYSMAIPLR